MAVDDQAVGGGFLGNLPPNVRIGVLIGAAVLVVGLLAFLFMRGDGEEKDDGFRTIYRNLPMAEAGNAKDWLEEEYRIPVKLANGGTEIRVPKEKAEEALVKLAQKNMPGSGIVGYEIFDKQSFISTDFEKRVALQRARDGHLSRMVGRFEGVKDARVNVVIPEPTLFSEEQLPTTASVLLEFAGGGGFKPEYIQAITHLIASATPGLKPGNVTVVDNKGQVLAEGQEGLYGEDSSKKLNKQLLEQMQVKRQMEQQLENKVIVMLEQLLGPGKVKATAEVQPNFDRIQERARLHKPVTVQGQGGAQEPTKVAERSVTEKNESDINKPLPGAGLQQGQTPPAETDKSKTERNNTQISYNYDNIEQLTSKETGFIERKSISVQFELPAVVEGEEAAEGGPAPLTKEEVEEMVKKAINFDEAQKDQIFVRQVKFDTSVYDKLKSEMEKAREKTPMWVFILIGLGGLVVGAGIGGALLGKKKAAAAEQFAAGVPQYAAIPGAMPGAPGLPGSEGAPGLPAAPGMPPMPAQQAQEVSRAPIMPPTPDNPFGFLQGVTPQTVAQLLSTERLPTLVAVLAQLDPSQAEDVINLLNPEIQNEVRSRLSQNPVLPPMTQKMVSQSLKKRLAAMSAGVS
jgi:flagellar M-ring protein FliF